MIKMAKSTISFVLAALLLFQMMPAQIAAAAEPEIYSINNGFLQVDVYGKNGGFFINTLTGNKLNKDSKNKNLLFPDGDYDTSFTSIRVTKGGKTRDYIFGRSYGPLGINSSKVTTAADLNSLVSTWTADNMTFTQNISLAGTGSAEHGMARISYAVENNSGEPAEISVRLLLDTALGFQDWAIYELPDASNVYKRVERESVYPGDIYAKAFFAYDDIYNPVITAYMVNAPIDGRECIPEKVAFGHWNNLAATVYDFAPDVDMTFTNPNNKQYLTADSAIAFYYDAKTVAQGASATLMGTYYGVYSNEKVAPKSRVSVNIAAPTVLELDAAKGNKEYMDGGKFTVSTFTENFSQPNAAAIKKAAIAVYASAGITPLDTFGGPLGYEPTYAAPYYIQYIDFEVGQTQTTNWSFCAEVDARASYRRIEYRVFDVSNTDMLLAENQIGQAGTLILFPGGDGLLPQIQFTGMSTPGIFYSKGTRYISLSGKNLDMLLNKAEYALRIRNIDPGILFPSGETSVAVPADRFEISGSGDAGSMHSYIMRIVLDDTMRLPAGTYEFYIDYHDPLKADIGAPALKFSISDDEKYRNESYGVLAVVKGGTAPKFEYTLKTFADEKAYTAYRAANPKPDILMDFRGIFTIKRDENENITKAEAVSQTDAKEDRISINDCLEFEKGTFAIEVKNPGKGNQEILVDFKGSLHTAGARTSVWNGVAAFTAIKNGSNDYALIPYDSNGDRQTDTWGEKKTIKLIWPSAASAVQTVAGFALQFRYGELGLMKDRDGKDMRVISFGAAMDLGFLIPSASKREPNLSAKDKMQLLLMKAGGDGFENGKLRKMEEEYEDDRDAKKEEQMEKGTTKVDIQDILYGNGKFIGVKFTAMLGLPSYSSGMPKMQGNLTVNTIGDWAVGFEGSGKMTKIELEFEIFLRSRNNVPIPDKLTFYINGFTPGINLDGAGVLWLQGGGGGIENLYDTIFGSGIPPIAILLRANMAILEMIEMQIDMKLSLQGFYIKATHGTVVGTGVEVLKMAQIDVTWIPYFKFIASLNINVLGCVYGAGYIVIEDDGFFEIFIRAGLSVPDAVPILGGIQIAAVDVGVSKERIWGGIKLLTVAGCSIAYYWGEGVDFSVGTDLAKPTYPQLLGYGPPVPVHYDAERNQTLYMQVGTNARIADSTYELPDAVPTLMGAEGTVESSADRKTHKLTLPDAGEADSMLVFEFAADSIAEAKAIAEGINITGYELKWLDASKEFNNGEQTDKNAYLSYNHAYDGAGNVTGIRGATVAVGFSGTNGEVYNITTPVACNLTLYLMDPIPELTSLVYDDATKKVTWDGNYLDEFDTVSFYAVDENGDGSALLGFTETPGKKAFNIKIPEDLQTGTYKIKAVANRENEFISTQTAATPLVHTNGNQPSSPGIAGVKNAGDYFIGAQLTPPAGTYDGYIVNIYEEVEPGVFGLHMASGMVFPKGTTEIVIGGRYTGTDKDGNELVYGLKANKKYKVGVSAYRETDTAYIMGGETKSDALTLALPSKPAVSISANVPAFKETVDGLADDSGQPAKRDVYTSEDIIFTVSSNQEITGKWLIDGGPLNLEETDGEYTSEELGGGSAGEHSTLSKSINILLAGLADGSHSLVFTGKNAGGDSVIFPYDFTIKTAPPRFLVSSPLSGGTFPADGKLTITGITDPGSVVSVKSNGAALYSGVPELDEKGGFIVPVTLDKSHAYQSITVSAANFAGKAQTKTLHLMNEALSDITGLVLYKGNENVTNKIFNNAAATGTTKLTLKAKTGSGTELILDGSSLVDWEMTVCGGIANVDSTGAVYAEKGSQGIVTAMLRVSDGGSLSAAAILGTQDTSSYKSEIIPVPHPPGYSTEQETKETTAINIDESESEMGDSNNGALSGPGITVAAKEGELVKIPLPNGIDPEYVAVRYTLPSGVHVVRMCAVIDGYILFIAPVTGEYEVYSASGHSFGDVKDHWAESYINFAFIRNLFIGVGENRFAPDGTMTRAMFATVLSRVEEADLSGFDESPFADVDIDAWYGRTVAWAAGTGIVLGYGDGRFGPGDAITREQMAAMIHRYLKWKGYGLSKKVPENTFADQNSISPWALEAVLSIQNAGIIVGKPGNLFDPQNTATRAEVATVFRRMIEEILKNR